MPIAYSSIKKMLYLLVFFLLPFSSFSNQNNEECDEVLLLLQVNYVGSTELSSFICGEDVYLSVPEVFDFIQIRNLPSEDLTSVEGFFINQNNTFLIDEAQNQISYKGKTTDLDEGDLIRTRTNLFLKSAYFGEVFELESTFNFRSLSVSISTEVELPSVKAARQKEMRANIRKLQKDFTADSTIIRDRPLFHFGAANWNLNSTQRTDGLHHSRFNLALGGLLAGGEFTGRLNYNTNQEFLARNQFYQWRYVNNENTALRQITAGKIGGRSIASIFNPVIGVQLTNAPTYLKKSFGTYVLSDYTKPDWMVELYINNVLVDYVQADATGFFSFDVPLMYGSTAVSLRFYGPWGEEEASDKNFSIPFNFLPAGDFEYTVSSGLVEDGDENIFAQARADYGLSNRITLGGGVEFLSALENTPVIPFLNTSVRLPYNMLLSGEYLHEVGVKGVFNYSSPSNIRLELNYSKYEKEQEAVRFNYLEERKAVLSVPLRTKAFSGMSRLTFRQNLLRNNQYMNAEWLLSGRALGLNMNLTTNAYFNRYDNPLVYSRLSTSIRFPKKIIFSPQLQYEFSSNSISSVRGELRKQVFKNAYLQASYDQNFKYDQFYLNLGFSFELNFSRVGLSSSTNKQHTSFSQSAGGSMVFEPRENHLKFDNRAMLGRGSLKFSPFLDSNGNGKKDELEPLIEGVSIHSTGSGLKEQTPEGATFFTGLEPYISYHFKINTTNLDRIAWRVEKETLNIFINPNQLKVVDIPVSIVGEVAGFVLEDKITAEDGIGGIKINVYDEKRELVKTILSEPDGFFSFLGLKTGSYTAEADPEQLARLNFKINEPVAFNINNTMEGDYVDDLEFVLDTWAEETAGKDGILADNNLEEKVNTSEGEEISQEKNAENEFIYKVLINPEEAPEKHTYLYIENNSPAAAANLQTQLKEEGFLDNRIVAIYTGEEMPVEDALAYEQQEKEEATAPLFHKPPKNIPGSSNERVVYKVQFQTSIEERSKGDAIFKGKGDFETYKENGRYAYLSGKTYSRYEATKIQNELREKGFPDAFVVHFNKNQKITPDEAFALREKISENTSVQVALQESEEKEKTSVISEPAGRNEKGLNPKAEKGWMYKVQLAASYPKLSATDSLFKGLQGIEVHQHEGMFKYTNGKSISFREANMLKNQLRQQGFPDAFVVPFYNNTRLNPWQVEGHVALQTGQLDGIAGINIEVYDQRGNYLTSALSEADGSFIIPGLTPGRYSIQLNEAQLENLQMNAVLTSMEININKESGVTGNDLEFVLETIGSQKTNIAETDASSGMVFKVQVLASKPKLSVTHQLLKGLKGVERQQHEGLYKFTWGEAKSLQEIRSIKTELEKRGFHDAFIVPYYNGKRINMQEATGNVYIHIDGKLVGFGGIKVNIYDADNKFITSLLSDNRGKMSFLGLRPGNYVAQLDLLQLDQLQLGSTTPLIDFKIGANTDGQISSPFEFILEQKTIDKAPAEKSIIFKVQIAASNVKLSFRHPVLKDHPGIEMHRHEGMYKYTLGNMKTMEEAEELRKELMKQGVEEAFVVPFINNTRSQLKDVINLLQLQE